MSMVADWRAEDAVIDRWYEAPPSAHEQALKHEADRAWIAHEIGDVPHRNTAEQWAPEQLAGWAKAVTAPYQFNRIPDYFGETVPVESLGRES